MKSNIQLKYSNYVAFSHVHSFSVNNSGLCKYFIFSDKITYAIIHLNKNRISKRTGKGADDTISSFFVILFSIIHTS